MDLISTAQDVAATLKLRLGWGACRRNLKVTATTGSVAEADAPHVTSNLANIQRVLAQLYTDARLREQFFADPGSVGKSQGMNGEEIAWLDRLCVSQIRFFAHLLHSKRRGEVAKMLPLTHLALGASFDQFFKRYGDGRVSQGSKKQGQDALDFAAFLCRELKRSRKERGIYSTSSRPAQMSAEAPSTGNRNQFRALLLPVPSSRQEKLLDPGAFAWLLDLVRYEWARLLAAARGGRLQAKWFHYPVHRLARGLKDEVNHLSSRFQPTLIIWIRWTSHSRLRRFVWSLPWFAEAHFGGNKVGRVTPCAPPLETSDPRRARSDAPYLPK